LGKVVLIYYRQVAKKKELSKKRRQLSEKLPSFEKDFC
jgi:hypothetical protein